MSDPQSTQPASSTASRTAHITRDAALIATFYVPRETETPLVRPLVELLVNGLELEQCNPGDRYLGSWRNLATQVFLNTFIPPAAHDTTVIQLVQNTQEPATTAWATMSKRLEATLNPQMLQSIWGYTLVYQAMLEQGGEPNKAIPSLQLSARPLKAPDKRKTRQLAQADVAGGKLWLLTIPLSGDGIEAGMVYVALSHYNPRDDHLVLDMLYGPGAALLMPDVIAHKCYNLMRQYQTGNLVEQYETLVNTLLTTTTRLIEKVQYGTSTEEDLHDLTRDHNRLDEVVSLLDELLVSLTAQVRGYRWWRERAGCGDVTEFHYSHLEAAHLDMEILVGKGKNALQKTSMNIQTIGTAMQIVQVNLDKEERKRDQVVQLLLAVVGAALAVPEFVGGDLIAETANIQSGIAQLGVQMVITVIFAFLIWLFIKFISASVRE